MNKTQHGINNREKLGHVDVPVGRVTGVQCTYFPNVISRIIFLCPYVTLLHYFLKLVRTENRSRLECLCC
jgi:hypothetical protein